MEELIKVENILENLMFEALLCKSCGNSSTNLQFCQKCCQAYCYSCSLNINFCINCNDNLNTRIASKTELMFLKTMKIKCSNHEYGCNEILSFEAISPHINECNYAKVKCKECNNLFLNSQIQQHYNDCFQIKRTCQECNYSNDKDNLNHNCQIILLKNSIKILQSEATILKEQISASRNETTEEIKQLNSTIHHTTLQITNEIQKMSQEIVNLKEIFRDLKLTNSKSCVVCKVKGRSVLCSKCNFKSCNSCYVSCLICNKNFCFNCSSSGVDCNICGNGICKDCKNNSSNLKEVLECCSHCKQFFCRNVHNLQKCADCNDLSCLSCMKRCKCDVPLCKKCKYNENSNFINISEHCNHNSSILVGCSHATIINLNPINMEINEHYNVSEFFDNNNKDVNNILFIEDKIITGVYNDKVRIWNDKKFINISNDIINVIQPRDIRQIKNGIFGILDFQEKQYLLVDSFQNKRIRKHSLITFPNTLCKVNDSTMAVGCSNGLIQVYKPRKVAEINAHLNKCVNSIIKLNKWGGQFASTGQDESVKLWSFDSKSTNITEITNKRISNANVVSNNWCKMKELKNGRVVHSTNDHSISIWDLNSMTNILINSHTSYIYDFFELSDNLLLSCSNDKTIKKWDLRYNKTPCGYLNYHENIFRFQSSD